LDYNEYGIGRNEEESCYGLILRHFSGIFLMLQRKITRNLRIVNFPTDIHNGHLPDTRLVMNGKGG
jgi:hypothetical protein